MIVLPPHSVITRLPLRRVSTKTEYPTPSLSTDGDKRIQHPHCPQMETKCHLRAGAVGEAVTGPDGGSPQLKVASLLIPADRKSTKPGWLVVMIPLIQAWYSDTLAYTPGKLGKAHPWPKLTTPDWTHCTPCLPTRGPPESPFRGRGSKPRWVSQIPQTAWSQSHCQVLYD